MLRFEELAYESTPMGELTLRRRHIAAAGMDVFEVKLGEEYLMSSLFTVAEEELARLRKENIELRTDREILRKAAAYFARETTR